MYCEVDAADQPSDLDGWSQKCSVHPLAPVIPSQWQASVGNMMVGAQKTSIKIKMLLRKVRLFCCC